MLKTGGLSVLLFGMSNDSSFEQSRLSCGYLITQLYSIQLLLLVEHSQPNFNRFAFLLETFAFYVIPIVKAKPKLQVSNYSSISLIPIFNQMFETLMYTRIFDFLGLQKTRDPHQFVFQKQKSSSLAIPIICVY